MSEQYCNWIDEYLAGDLDDAKRQEFQVHLSQCAACSEEVRLEQKINRSLAAAHPFAPVDLQRSVGARIRQRQSYRLARLAVAAILLVCAVAGWRVWLGHRPNLPKSQQAPDRQSVTSSSEQHLHTYDLATSISSTIDMATFNPASAHDGVAVDAGPDAIVVSQPSSNSTVHVFWLYPTVNVSSSETESPVDSEFPKENNL